MCNLYDIGPTQNKNRAAWRRRLVEAAESLPRLFGIRKTDPAVVLRVSGGDWVPEIMNWGFERDFNPAVNNARLDKLASPMWRSAIAERRCAIPVSAFYEWSGTAGHKQTHAFLPAAPETEWLWMAGIWEKRGSGVSSGARFSMITTSAREPVASIHDRMPVVLPEEALEAFLAGEEFQGADPETTADRAAQWLHRHSLVPAITFRCLNPLKDNRLREPVEEGFLF